MKFFVSQKNGRNNGVLIVANRRHPDVVAKAVKKTLEAGKTAGPDAGRAVMQPIISGAFEHRSYAIWPRHKPLSRNRLLRAIQNRRLRPQVFSWLREVTRHSAAQVSAMDEMSKKYRAPLEFLINDSATSSEVRARASNALRAFQSGAWPAVTILQHSDFWLGNILLPRTNFGQSDGKRIRFYVIDWGGAELAGYPFFDLARYCISSGVPVPAARREVLRQSKILNCEPETASFYALCALGAIGLKPGFFPKERYVEMCARVNGFFSETAERKHLARPVSDIMQQAAH